MFPTRTTCSYRDYLNMFPKASALDYFYYLETCEVDPVVIEWTKWEERYKQLPTSGLIMRPSHLYGKCVCYVCKLAEFAGRNNQKRHCGACGYCMFVLCPNTFVFAWDYRLDYGKQSSYFCGPSSDIHLAYNDRGPTSYIQLACERRQRESRVFMLWLCWLRQRRNVPSGLGKLPREIIRIITGFLRKLKKDNVLF